MATFQRFVDSAAYSTALVGPLLVCGVFMATRPGPIEAVPLEAEHGPAVVQAQALPIIPEVEPAPAPPPAPPRGAVTDAGLDIALVTYDGLLVREDSPTDWAASPLPTPDAAGAVGKFLRVELKADTAKLPPALANAIGTKVDLYAARGKVCTGTLSGYRLVAERVGEEDDLTEGLELDQESWTIDEENAALLLERVWQTEKRWLVADVDGCDEHYEQAIFGRSSSLPAPSLLTASRRNWRDVPAPDRAGFRKHARAALGESFDSYAEEGNSPSWGNWEAFYSDTIRYTVFEDATGTATMARALVGDTWSWCGSDFGEWTHRFITLDGVAKIADQEGPREPVMFVDVDGDGAFEVIGDAVEHEGYALFDASGTWLLSGFRSFVGCRC